MGASVLTISHLSRERQFFIDNVLVRIHFIIVMTSWTGLAPWELVNRPCAMGVLCVLLVTDSNAPRGVDR